MIENSIASACLEIHALGSFQIKIDGEPVAENRWPRRKPQLLVKLLALQPRHQIHREQLLELLWPELDQTSATNNLHKTIYMARRALEPDLKSGAASHFIFTQGQQVMLRAPLKLWIDVEEFERRAAEAIKTNDIEAARAALSLYEGDLLGEDLYEDWAAAKREQLRGLHRDLLAWLARLYESRKQLAQSIECMKELLSHDATDEEAHRDLMRLYAITGSRHQAQRQYQLCSEAMRRELDAEPEQETVEMWRRIESGEYERACPREAERDQAIESIAVLPLVNGGGDAAVEYLSDAITESIINSLSPLPRLRVMARSIVRRYKGSEVDPQSAGREMGVQAVVTGRMAQMDNRLLIGAELVDVADGSQLWGGQFNRSIADIFQVQEEIAGEISEKLRLRLVS
ncbi:MAG TPA: BTAD domain-containing putative transcriptional regulator [Blastocatellia bacterium]